MNECIEGTDNCHTNADCTDTVGSFQCTCSPGYSGDGIENCTGQIPMTCTCIQCHDQIIQVHHIQNLRLVLLKLYALQLLHTASLVGQDKHEIITMGVQPTIPYILIQDQQIVKSMDP